MRLRFIDPVRMCGKCQKIAKWENDYFNNYQKKLKVGEELNVETEKGETGLGTVSLGGDGGLLQITFQSGPVVPILMDEVCFAYFLFFCSSCSDLILLSCIVLLAAII